MNNFNVGSFDMKEAVYKLNLTIGRFTIGRNILFEHLRLLNILQDGDHKNIPYGEYLDKGYFVVTPVRNNGGLYLKVFVTDSGLQWLQTVIKDVIIAAEKKYWLEYYPKYVYLLGI